MQHIKGTCQTSLELQYGSAGVGWCPPNWCEWQITLWTRTSEEKQIIYGSRLKFTMQVRIRLQFHACFTPLPQPFLCLASKTGVVGGEEGEGSPEIRGTSKHLSSCNVLVCWRASMASKEVHSSPQPIGSISPEASKEPFECIYLKSTVLKQLLC